MKATLKEGKDEMIEVNTKSFEIEVKETFSFECNALPELEIIEDNIQFEYENGDVEDCKEEIENFLDHELTDDDKVNILECIKHEFEEAQYIPDCNISIFDTNVIIKGIESWIENEFGFNPSDIY